jgi:hypothetical protein
LSIQVADPRNYLAHDVLKDGTEVTVRAIRHDDDNTILDAFKNLDRDSVYRRFFSPKKDLTAAELEQLTDVDFSQVVALVVAAQGKDGEILIGGGRYACNVWARLVPSSPLPPTATTGAVASRLSS